MNSERAVLAAIDALIDEQLEAGEPETGYDYDNPDFPECRCGGDWHGLPTRRCPGSDSEGPVLHTWALKPDSGLGPAWRVFNDELERVLGAPDAYGPLVMPWRLTDSRHTPAITAAQIAACFGLPEGLVGAYTHTVHNPEAM